MKFNDLHHLPKGFKMLIAQDIHGPPSTVFEVCPFIQKLLHILFWSIVQFSAHGS